MDGGIFTMELEDNESHPKNLKQIDAKIKKAAKKKEGTQKAKPKLIFGSAYKEPAVKNVFKNKKGKQSKHEHNNQQRSDNTQAVSDFVRKHFGDGADHA